MNNRSFKFEGNPFSKNTESNSKTYHEVLLLMKFLQTIPQVKNMNVKYYDLYFTVIKNRDDKVIVDDQYEDIENDHINFNDFITPNHNISIKPRETILK